MLRRRLAPDERLVDSILEPLDLARGRESVRFAPAISSFDALSSSSTRATMWMELRIRPSNGQHDEDVVRIRGKSRTISSITNREVAL